MYVSAWLKCHHPAAFACALLNSQPMGFYAPAQIVRDAREHGVEVRPIDVAASDWDCTLEEGALRLGFRSITGFSREWAEKVLEARSGGWPPTPAPLPRGEGELLTLAHSLRWFVLVCRVPLLCCWRRQMRCAV